MSIDFTCTVQTILKRLAYITELVLFTQCKQETAFSVYKILEASMKASLTKFLTLLTIKGT